MNKAVHCRLLPVVVVIFFFSFAACEKDADLEDISGKLWIELREAFAGEDSGRQIALYVSTEDQYPCINFEIHYAYSHAHGIRNVSFKGIRLPGLCITAVGPARAFVELGPMEPGSREVVFEINEDRLVTSFTVDEQLLTVQEVKGESLRVGFVETTMYRVAPHTVWGYIRAKDPDNGPRFSDFLKLLKEAGAKEMELSPGNYGFFRVSEEGGFVLFDGMTHYRPDTPFVVAFDDDFDILCDIALSFSDAYVIALYSARGEAYHNQ